MIAVKVWNETDDFYDCTYLNSSQSKGSHIIQICDYCLILLMHYCKLVDGIAAERLIIRS
jgi:hypothetical protein